MNRKPVNYSSRSFPAEKKSNTCVTSPCTSFATDTTDTTDTTTNTTNTNSININTNNSTFINSNKLTHSINTTHTKSININTTHSIDSIHTNSINANSTHSNTIIHHSLLESFKPIQKSSTQQSLASHFHSNKNNPDNNHLQQQQLKQLENVIIETINSINHKNTNAFSNLKIITDKIIQSFTLTSNINHNQSIQSPSTQSIQLPSTHDIQSPSINDIQSPSTNDIQSLVINDIQSLSINDIKPSYNTQDSTLQSLFIHHDSAVALEGKSTISTKIDGLSRKINLKTVQTKLDAQDFSKQIEYLIVSNDTSSNQYQPKVNTLDAPTTQISPQQIEHSKVIPSEKNSILPKIKPENLESTQKEDPLNFTLPSFTLDMSDLFEFF